MSAAPVPSLLRPLPRWVLQSGERLESPAQAGFAAGAAVFALDQLVSADPPWLGAWRSRQALAAAAASARILRLREDEETTLRDALHLTRPGDDPGPPGRLHRAWRVLARSPARPSAAVSEHLARELGVASELDAVDIEAAWAPGGDPAAAAAEVATRVSTASGSPLRAEVEVLGLMLADAALAARLGWPNPVPLLATAILHPSSRQGSGRRPRPGDPGWTTACFLALARAAAGAHARGVDLERRAVCLSTAARKVRTKGGASAVAALFSDDAVTAASLKGLGSDRAARRLLERLVALGAVRELTGRPVFRLYGL